MGMRRVTPCLAGCVIAFLVGRPPPAVAQITWIGDTSTAWTTGANWEGGVAPTAADQVVFGAEFGDFQPSLTSGTVLRLNFLRPAGGWTVTTSGTLTLNSTNAIDDSLNTSGTTTIDGRLVLAASGTKTVSVGAGGTLRVTGILDISSSTRVVNILGGVVSTNGLRGGGSTGAGKSGDGTLVILASSTFINAAFSLHGGTLILGDRLAIGSTALNAAPATTIQASTDLTGANRLPNQLRIPVQAGVSSVTISGTQSLEFFAARMGHQFSGAALTNDVTAGKTLTLGSVEGNASFGNRTLTFQGSGHTIVTGSMINGATGNVQRYTKAGSGTLTLRGEGLFSGTMAVTAGTLKVENALALGTTAPLVVSGGLLDLGGHTVTKSGTITLSGGTTANGTLVNDTVAFAVSRGTVSANLAGTVGLTKTSNNLLVLSGSNSYGGATTTSAGILQFAARNALYGGTSALWTAANLNTSGTLAVSVGGAGEFDTTDVTTLLTNLGGLGGAVNNDGLRAGSGIGFDTTNAAGSTFTIADEITDSTGTGGGAIGLVKLGSGTLVLSGSSSYTGGTRVLGGVLRLGNASAIGSGSITIDGGVLDLNGYSGSSGALTLGGVAAQTGFTGGGTLALGGTVTYTSSPAGAVIEPDLDLGGTTRTFNIGGSGTGDDFVGVSGVVSSTAGLTKTGNGRLVLSNTANTFTGKTTIQAGIVEVASLSGTTGVASSLGAPTSAANNRIDLGTGTTVATLRYAGTGHATDRPLYLSGSAGGGAILDASGSGTVAFTGGVSAAAGTKTLTLTGTNAGSNYIQGIGDASNVTKTGSGTWVFGGTNSFSGTLAIQQGTAIAAGSAPSGGAAGGVLGQSNNRIVMGLADTTGTAALLAMASGTINRGIDVVATGSTGTQEVILGGSGPGSSLFGESSAIYLDRDVTLAADAGHDVAFASSWLALTGTDGAPAAFAINVGTADATGTVSLRSALPETVPALNVRRGTLRLDGGGNETTPMTVGSDLGTATVDLTGQSQALQTLAFGGTAGLIVPGGVGGELRLSGSTPTVTAATGAGHRIESGIALDSDATFDVTAAAARLAVTGGITGSAGLTKTGLGTLAFSGASDYTGATDVNAGTLAVDGILGETAVTIANGATLTGTGTLGGFTTILGTHSPGASPGIETFASGLSYSGSSTLVWELIANTSSGTSRGILFDGVDLTGGALSITSGATLSLVFDLPGSTVNWNDGFWGSEQFWTVIDVSGSGSWDSSLFTTLSVGVDSTNATLESKRAGSSFQVVESDGDLVLQYVFVIPEPGTLALAAIGLAAAAALARRRAGQRG